ncbi:hypothetical protein PCC8801_3010 [Rippkaea orientalis PCC 8801]|uniref:DUF433 domain-containing protein n=2 Tax=Rippkaea TaxID=2546365 RepID=B7JWF1_RIPO1|nr:DUF433 domain-containing protein [Rippkaea orientalis]ACK66996.1 hypothetical protein PCC8801_3010 [Rippkaea orientalis PCC 8801]
MPKHLVLDSEDQLPRLPFLKIINIKLGILTPSGGKPCIRRMRVTVGTVFGLMGAGRTPQEILEAYPCSNPR